MELWIRSQDKRKLIPIKEELYIPYSRTGEDFGIFYKDNILAHFKKEERALEVLDEIQNCLLANFNFDGSYEEVDIKIKAKMINGLYGIIYEMPKD